MRPLRGDPQSYVKLCQLPQSRCRRFRQQPVLFSARRCSKTHLRSVHPFRRPRHNPNPLQKGTLRQSLSFSRPVQGQKLQNSRQQGQRLRNRSLEYP